MDSIGYNRKKINNNQTELRKALTSGMDYQQAVKMLSAHHANLHSGEVSQYDKWSFEDAILDEISEEIFRRIPKNCEHSIVWCIWHLARIEDITMNLLIAGDDQIFFDQNWPKRLGVDVLHSGNEMERFEIEHMSQTIDLHALRKYRSTVGKKTQDIIIQLSPMELNSKVNPTRIKKVKEEGGVVKEAYGITDYWSKRTIAGLLLMPATRHNIVHLNEALRLKKRIN